jgi:transcriptional regulator with GAF, ATPase, and Fis domain
VPSGTFGASSETVVAVGSTSTFRQAESSVIIEALRAAAGRIAGRGGAAERLGLKRTTLSNGMKRNSICRLKQSGDSTPIG